MKNYSSILKNIFGFHLILILIGIGVIYLTANDIGEFYVDKWVIYVVGGIFIVAGFLVLYTTIANEKGIKEEDMYNSTPYIILTTSLVAMFSAFFWYMIYQHMSDVKDIREFVKKIDFFYALFIFFGIATIIILILNITELMKRLILGNH